MHNPVLRATALGNCRGLCQEGILMQTQNQINPANQNQNFLTRSFMAQLPWVLLTYRVPEEIGILLVKQVRHVCSREKKHGSVEFNVETEISELADMMDTRNVQILG